MLFRSSPARARAPASAARPARGGRPGDSRPRPAGRRAWCSIRWTASSSAIGCAASAQTVHLLGASIGAWRMADRLPARRRRGAGDAGRRLRRRSTTSTQPGRPPTARQRQHAPSAPSCNERLGSRAEPRCCAIRASGCTSSPAAAATCCGAKGAARTPLGYARRVRGQRGEPARAGRRGSSAWSSATRATRCHSRCATTRAAASR
ncbi:MAG: hypothetical protein MZW92_56245 [Comamonadaceae bacterium]|nr:hypothetical protein [Comamonadaceae bacterium]